ncbi:MAG: hypothetical protein AAGE18_02565 [Pseudomonadota bacterium]
MSAQGRLTTLRRLGTLTARAAEAAEATLLRARAAETAAKAALARHDADLFEQAPRPEAGPAEQQAYASWLVWHRQARARLAGNLDRAAAEAAKARHALALAHGRQEAVGHLTTRAAAEDRQTTARRLERDGQPI